MTSRATVPALVAVWLMTVSSVDAFLQPQPQRRAAQPLRLNVELPGGEASGAEGGQDDGSRSVGGWFSTQSDVAIAESLRSRAAELKIAPLEAPNDTVIDASEARQRYYAAFFTARRKAVRETLDKTVRASTNQTTVSVSGDGGGSGSGSGSADSSNRLSCMTAPPASPSSALALRAPSPREWAWAALLACSCYGAQECLLMQFALGLPPNFDVGSATGLGLLASVLFGATSIARLLSEDGR